MNELFQESGAAVDYARTMMELEDASVRVEVDIDITDGDPLADDADSDTLATAMAQVVEIIMDELPKLNALKTKGQRLVLHERLLAVGVPTWMAEFLAWYAWPKFLLPEATLVTKMGVSLTTVDETDATEKGEDA